MRGRLFCARGCNLDRKMLLCDNTQNGFSTGRAAIDLVRKAHGQLPQCKLLGWDVAITPTGADIVEANNAPGTLLMQIGDMVPKGEKILQVIRQEEKKKH